MESYGSSSKDDDQQWSSHFSSSSTRQQASLDRAMAFSPPAPTSDVGRQTTQPADVDEDSSDDGELRPAYIEQQQWGLRRQRRTTPRRLCLPLRPNGKGATAKPHRCQGPPLLRRGERNTSHRQSSPPSRSATPLLLRTGNNDGRKRTVGSHRRGAASAIFVIRRWEDHTLLAREQGGRDHMRFIVAALPSPEENGDRPSIVTLPFIPFLLSKEMVVSNDVNSGCPLCTVLTAATSTDESNRGNVTFLYPSASTRALGGGFRPQQQSGIAWRQSILPCSSSLMIVTRRLSRNRAGESNHGAQQYTPLCSPSGDARQRSARTGLHSPFNLSS
nr:hypothetical protein Iba_chr12dCG8820 [Ipomoea batatas]